MSDTAAVALLAFLFAAGVTASIATAVYISIWLTPLVMVACGTVVGELAWKLSQR